MFTEDLYYFFNTDDFAIEAIYQGNTIINGIMGKAYVNLNDVESSLPAFSCASADVPNVAHDDTLEISGIDYLIKIVKPDGTGVVVLVLEEQ
jgi:hypothetical protein